MLLSLPLKWKCFPASHLRKCSPPRQKRRQISYSIEVAKEMFGRVRASSSSPDDLERSTAKLLKHDSLSIYECTLLKLRVGSRHAQDTSHIALYPENDVMDTEADENCALALSPKAKISSQQERMTVDDAASTSASTFRTDGSYHHLPISRPHSSRNPSVIYLFSRYKGPKDPSSHDKKMKPEVGCSSGISPSSGIDVDKQMNQNGHFCGSSCKIASDD